MSITRALAAAAIAAAALATTTPALADDGIAGTFLAGRCNGLAADTNCTYCSWQGGYTAQDPYNCNHYAGYYWRTCTLYSDGICLVG